MKRIIYIGTYKLPNDGVRTCSLAAVNKMNFIIDLLNKNGYAVDIYSAAPLADLKGNPFFVGARREDLPDGYNRLFQAPSLKVKNKFLEKLNTTIAKLWYLWTLLFLPKNSTLLVYHVLHFIDVQNLLKRIRNFDYILEVEEIYTNIVKSNFSSEKEMKYLLQFNKYIYVSDAMRKEIGKPGIVIYGNYNKQTLLSKKDKSSSLIRLLYSGTIDKIRGAFLAVHTMHYLPDNYILKITGVGEAKDLKDLQEEIKALNKLKGRDCCHFLGKLPDKEYEQLLSQTDIALNTQIDGIYSKFLFPSKLINYLRYGLQVVTTPGESIVTSCFYEVVHVTEGYNPSDIAKTIMSCDIDINKSGLDVLEKYHNQAIYEIGKMLE